MATDPFVTAEESTSTRQGVWLLLSTWSIKLDDGRIVPDHFEITTSSGYKAFLRACGRIADGEHGTPCLKLPGSDYQHGMSVDKWCEHLRSACHAYHLEHAQAFRDRVQKTYGKGISA